MISMKLHEREGELLVAACDSEILGKTFRGGGLRIEVSRSFYGGEEGDEEMLVARLGMATIANLIGKNTVDIAAKHGFVDMACVLTIGGVPHAQIARMM
jgi:hypothetical protein